MRLRFRPRPFPAVIIGASGALLAACILPTGSCACSPARDQGIAFGQLRTGAGVPVAGAQLHALTCGAAPAQVLEVSTQYYSTMEPSAADGSYEMRVFTGPGDAACVRVVAVRAPGDSAFTDIQPFRITSGAATVRQQVDVVFP